MNENLNYSIQYVYCLLKTISDGASILVGFQSTLNSVVATVYWLLKRADAVVLISVVCQVDKSLNLFSMGDNVLNECGFFRLIYELLVLMDLWLHVVEIIIWVWFTSDITLVGWNAWIYATWWWVISRVLRSNTEYSFVLYKKFNTPAVWIPILTYIGPAGVLCIDSVCRPGLIKR